MRVGYERLAELDEVLHRARQLAVRTVIFDIEPLVAYWDSGQAALDQGVALIRGQIETVPSVQVLCFATNSVRRPSGLPGDDGVRVIYLASAGKPLRLASYRSFPRPGMVIGDQIATDGILARRLGYVFVQCSPPLDRVPAGPRLMDRLRQLVRPPMFTPPSP